ncbi:MAG: tRNA 2-thiouridine(34) synthase MnmA [Planctomycetaceae bacterium]|nr:tRNA 2-thiouridine(34) synthase MnmA [Planctomycetaceae bacterium]
MSAKKPPAAVTPPVDARIPKFKLQTPMHIVLAISGGVDSTAAALLLLQAGHRVSGVFLSHPWQSPSDAEDAVAVAGQLGIACHIVDFSSAFEKLVDTFADEYFAGRTPNPCALCNRDIKFGRLYDTMQQLGGDFLATGHYIRRMTHEHWLASYDRWRAANGAEPISERLHDGFDAELPAICRARDHGKDQSYIMFGVAREKLARLLFPVGDYEKSAIRELVAAAGYDFSQKRESQEICFVPDHEHVRLINERRPGRPTAGNLVSVNGTVLGTHNGFEQFTVGQRKGMRMGFGGRRYVVRLDADTCDVVIGTRDDLARTELTASSCHWLIRPPSEPFRCQVKIRYRSPAAWATVTPLGGALHSNDDAAARIRVTFDEPCHAVAPGQVAACYLNDRIIGGGWIEAT